MDVMKKKAKCYANELDPVTSIGCEGYNKVSKFCEYIEPEKIVSFLENLECVHYPYANDYEGFLEGIYEQPMKDIKNAFGIRTINAVLEDSYVVVLEINLLSKETCLITPLYLEGYDGEPEAEKLMIDAYNKEAKENYEIFCEAFEKVFNTSLKDDVEIVVGKDDIFPAPRTTIREAYDRLFDDVL